MSASLGRKFVGYRTTLCIIAATSLWSCTATMHEPEGPLAGVNPDGSPRWVARSSGAYEGRHGKAFYGVGIAENIRSEAMARRTADDRARHEIGRLFKVYLSSLTQDYMRATTAGDPQTGGSSEEQDIVATQRTLSEVTLRGVQIREHWRDPQTGTLYALAVLKLGQMLGALQSAGVNGPLVEHVRSNAKTAFDQMDRELAKPRHNPAAAPPTSAAPQDTGDARSAEAAPAPAPTAKANAPRVGLQIRGSESANLQTCFAERLINAGYQLIEGSTDVDYVVEGSVQHRRSSPVQGTVLIRSTLDLRVKDLASGKTLAALTKTLKIGRPTYKAAVLNATARLCKAIVPDMAQRIQAAIDAN